MKNKFFVILVALLALAVFAFVELPVLKFDFMSIYIILIIFFALIGFLSIKRSDILTVPKLSKISFAISSILVVFVLVAPFVSSAPLFHAKAYRNLLGDVKESDFSKDVSPVSVEDIRLVDEQTAIRLGDKKMGEIPGLGSVAKLGKFHIQSVGEELYWVAPLVHRDVIKWVTNLDGTTGYIMVSATNPQDVRFVQELDGKPVKIVYQPDAYLLQDLARHVYLSGYFNVGLTDFTFEINDEGKPFWVVTLYEHKIGFAGSDAIGVATVNATTGEVASYTIDKAPKWIDRIQPENFIENQINNWGTYVNGFLNAKIAEEGVLVPTPGTSLVYGSDGKAYWYTGITSSGADDATIGFVLVDSRTKETRLYKQPGATESAAMRSAEGKVQEKGYTATFPVMYNILGTPTYVMSLKDKADLIKMVAFVSVEDYSLLGLGENKQDALRNYKDALKAKGNNITIGSETSTSEATGVIKRINQDVIDGNTYYYFTLDTIPKLIFTTSSTVSKEVPLTIVGDTVRITYDRYGSDNVDVLSFDNTMIESTEK
ncbi:MAG: hypothetical protein AB9856_05420 [Cellulosilyticaceae bacterium]